MQKMMNLLAAAAAAYDAAADLRSRRQRYKLFTYGSQWGDTVRDHDGSLLSEGELAARDGRVPLTNNMIRRLVKNVVGRFRSELQPLDRELKHVADMNRLDEIDSRLMEEFLISGCAVQRICCENRSAGEGIWVDNVDPRRFFVDHLADPRCADVEMVGMIRDMSLSELLMRYARNNRRKADEIRSIYTDTTMPSLSMAETKIGGTSAEGFDFFRCEPGRCRVIEIWTLDASERFCCHDPLKATAFFIAPGREAAVERTNRSRRRLHQPEIEMKWEIAVCWHCRVLAPTGELIYEADSSLPGGRHPFVLKFYPLTDGEVHSFVEDVIDQQKYVNRLITLIDNIMSASAKGVLLFPEDQLGTGLRWRDVAAMWAAYDGIIPYRPRSGVPGPQQIVAKGADAGASDLLKLEMKLFEDVSGVAGVLQGRTDGGAASAQLYDAQVKSASAAIHDLLASFNDFRDNRNRLLAAIVRR